MQSEALYADPAGVMRELYEFIGVDPDHAGEKLRPQNVGHNRTRVPAEVVEYLEDYFRPHNAELERFLGRSFDW